MKQRTQAEAIRLEYEVLGRTLDKLHNKLYRLLDKAQNLLPHGDADGSLIDTEYNTLRVIERRTLDLMHAITAKPMYSSVSADNDIDELP